MTRTQVSPPLRLADDVAVLFRARYLEMVRLADLLGADGPEDIAEETWRRHQHRSRQAHQSWNAYAETTP